MWKHFVLLYFQWEKSNQNCTKWSILQYCLLKIIFLNKTECLHKKFEILYKVNLDERAKKCVIIHWLMQRKSSGCVECLDLHNSVNVDAIDWQLESNIVECTWIGITLLDCDQLTGTLKIRHVTIREPYLSNGWFYKNYVKIVGKNIIPSI